MWQVGIRSDVPFDWSDIHGTTGRLMPSTIGAPLRDAFNATKACIASL